jgi:hypothetical protein
MRLVKRPLFIVAMCGALGLAACGGGDDDDDSADDVADDSSTDDSTDDSADDTGDDATDDGGVNPDGEDNTYVIDSLSVPANQGEVTEFGLDIDGNGTVENKFGGLFALLATAASLDISAAVNEQIALGGIILLANLKATDLADATGVGMYVYLGENADPAPCPDGVTDPAMCGLHLAGDASFDISADSPADAEVIGAIEGGAFVGGPGSVTIELALAALGEPITLTLESARVETTVSPDGLTSGVLGGAITLTDIETQVYPAVAAVVNGLIEGDPECDLEAVPCSCASGSTGALILGFLDVAPKGGDGDCVISTEEIAANPLVNGQLGTPDVDVDPDVDGLDAVSIGIGFSAVGAAFTP